MLFITVLILFPLQIEEDEVDAGALSEDDESANIELDTPALNGTWVWIGL